MEEQAKPTVSVVMITYGHEAFIRQAVEGVLMQECDFPVELIVADDCSPDNTPAVMQEILTTHPRASWVRYVRHEKNKGMMPNFMWALQQANGKYIALCDGDDFWTDPHKLQKQVNYLEKNQNIAVVCHDAMVVDRNGKEIKESAYAFSDHQRDLSPEELMMCKCNVLTQTMCFRNNFSKIPKEMKKAFFGDTFLTSILGEYGGSKYFPNKMAAYRKSGIGVYSGATISNRLGHSIQTYKQLSKYYQEKKNQKLTKHFLNAAGSQNRQHIYYSIKEKNKKQLFIALRENFLLHKSHSDKQKMFTLIKIFLKNIFK